MRAAAFLIPLLFLFPTASASETYSGVFVMQGAGCGGDHTLIRNCATYFPTYDLTRVDVQADDVSGSTIRLRICHEWTYDDGSHARVVCRAGCSPSFGDALSFPPWPHNTTYRVIVDLRGGPGACQAPATAGNIVVAFT